MPPQTAYLRNHVSVDVSRHHADPCYLATKSLSVEHGCFKHQKEVSFNEVVKAKKTIHISNFSTDEIDNCWYTENDFEVMKRDVRFEVNLLENECIKDEGECEQGEMRHSTRGLQMFTKAGSKLRRECKRFSRNVVIEEQELQREEGSNDAEYIAEIYAMATKSARRLALEAAC